MISIHFHCMEKSSMNIVLNFSLCGPLKKHTQNTSMSKWRQNVLILCELCRLKCPQFKKHRRYKHTTTIYYMVQAERRKHVIPIFFPLPFSSVMYKCAIPYLFLADTPLSVSASIILTTVCALAHRPRIQNPHYALPLSDVTKNGNGTQL